MREKDILLVNWCEQESSRGASGKFQLKAKKLIRRFRSVFSGGGGGQNPLSLT